MFAHLRIAQVFLTGNSLFSWYLCCLFTPRHDLLLGIYILGFTADFLPSACKRNRKVSSTDFQLDLTELANFYTSNVVCVWHAGLRRRVSYTSR
jgi:hypothetical protein